ncbi:T9SS type A sorting domain-containing protein [Candidatus Falkowbacteria bacterium]|nr:T9SS type A sorting domain-containing protein [Candidatus Falkowbacteria bacterium]
MKKLMLFLGFWFILLSGAFSQERPIVVDNSRFFPPVRSQVLLDNSSHFSLIYYLKSAIWNKRFDRDPSLTINQFSHSFVWNQNIFPGWGSSNINDAVYFMKNQGCATMSDFPASEVDDKLQPSLEVRHKALAYKSKGLHKVKFSGGSEPDSITKYLEELKDSLIKGTSFVIGLPYFPYFVNMPASDSIYDSYEGVVLDSVMDYHAAVVVGYNDTIKTAQGRGALIVKISSDKTKDGLFYLDYNWFYFLNNYVFYCYFLEEDFSSKPSIAMKLDLSNFSTWEEVYQGKNIFSDTIIQYLDGKFDFVDYYNYFYNRNQAQIVEVNGRRLPLRNNTILFPANSTDGNYQIVSDVTPLVAAKDFKSLSVVVFEPVSAAYYDASNRLMYGYERAPTAQVDNAFLSFLGTDKKIQAKVKDLADTTFVFNDFYAFRIGVNLNPKTWGSVLVKNHISKVKRKLITFSIADDNAPVFVNYPQDTLITHTNKELNFTFTATDADNNSLIFFLDKPIPEVSLLADGQFTFLSDKIGVYNFTVGVSDGINIVLREVIVRVDLSNSLKDIKTDIYKLSFFPNPLQEQGRASFFLPQRSAVNLNLYDVSGRLIDSIASQEYEAGQQEVFYDASRLPSGVYLVHFKTKGFFQSFKIIKQ